MKRISSRTLRYFEKGGRVGVVHLPLDNGDPRVSKYISVSPKGDVKISGASKLGCYLKTVFVFTKSHDSCIYKRFICITYVTAISFNELSSRPAAWKRCMC